MPKLYQRFILTTIEVTACMSNYIALNTTNGITYSFSNRSYCCCCCCCCCCCWWWWWWMMMMMSWWRYDDNDDDDDDDDDNDDDDDDDDDGDDLNLEMTMKNIYCQSYTDKGINHPRSWHNINDNIRRQAQWYNNFDKGGMKWRLMCPQLIWVANLYMWWTGNRVQSARRVNTILKTGKNKTTNIKKHTNENTLKENSN